MKTKENKGITLIALVLTIIVLLILAGISISMISGENGILNRAQEAKKKTEIASKEEQRNLAQAEAITHTGKTTYKGLTLPEGFAPTRIEGEDSVDDGLVITDGYGNEYIWIEVPKTTTVYSTAELDIINFTDEEYEKIENDLHTYTNDYRNQNNFSDTYYQDSAEGWFTEKGETSYDVAKKKMLKSVYENGGFWMGRYEAGIEGDVSRNSYAQITAGDRAVVKQNMLPYNWVTLNEAQELATRMNYEDCTSSLIFGIQWDLTLKYIETKNATTQSNLVSDSTSIGNYKNAEFTLSGGKFAENGSSINWYDYNSEERKDLVNEGKKITNSIAGIILTTGATMKTKLQNIYDIAGNLYEWTLEYCDDSNPYVCRGGSYPFEGSTYPARYRSPNTDGSAYHDVGFRIGLWK